MAKSLSRASILSAPVVSVEVEVPEWGGTVRVRRLSLRSRMAMLDVILQNENAVQEWHDDQALPVNERKGVAKVDRLDNTIMTLLYAIVDDKGQPVFTIADYDRFTDMDYDTLAALWLAAMRQQPKLDRNEQKKSSD